MNKTALFFITAAIACGALQGQNVVFQQAGAIGGQIRVSDSGFGIVSSGLMGGRPITGSPFSATEQRHSLQVLGNGTRIEQTENSQITRDAEGRTRIEIVPGTSDAPAIVTINDPVAGTNYFLDPVHKTANKLPLPKVLSGASGGSLPAPVALSAHIAVPAAGAAQVVSVLDGPSIVRSSAAAPGAAPVDEDLGAQNVNGVLAKGTRSTITIPAGQIGNDRALQVVNERWYSDELGMIVKSSNSDPRFGTITYELTNISRSAPDPSLFQVPADYTVNEGKEMLRTIQTK